jgi:hypothetical protein
MDSLFTMAKTQWYLFRVEELQIKLISKAFATKERAEKERLKLPARERRATGVGCVKP